jgi:hypothetical protein
MRNRIAVILGLAVIAVGSCTVPVEPGFQATELDAYCAVATRADLVSWVGDVVTFCEQGEIDAPGTCSAGRVLGGEVEMIDFGDARIRLALPASNGRLIVLLEDQRLVLTDGQGNVQRELDQWAADPAVSADGERVAWIGLPTGFDPGEDGTFGVPKAVAVMSLADQERTVLVEDAMASAPRPVPGSHDVLYVSGNEEGISAFFLVGPERGATQITNIGLVDDGAEFDPVAGSAAVFAPNGSLFYSVTGLEGVDEPIDDPDAEPPPEDDLENGEVVDDAELDIPRLFRLVLSDDVATVQEVGEGGWPILTEDGNVLASLPTGSSPCAMTYTPRGTP